MNSHRIGYINIGDECWRRDVLMTGFILLMSPITLDAPNVQHLNSPKKCCTLGTLPRKNGDKIFDKKTFFAHFEKQGSIYGE